MKNNFDYLLLTTILKFMQQTKRKLFALILFGLSIISAQAKSFNGEYSHKIDFYDVLGLQENAAVTEWMKFISYDMMDAVYNAKPCAEYGGLNFYNYLKSEFPTFKCKHRFLFHWGFNSRPWSKELEEQIKRCYWYQDSSELARFKQCFVIEQKRRNGIANKKTEEVFGFASGGKDASYANAIISIVYDTHLLGDYVPTNTDLEGLQDLNSVVGDIINSARKIDYEMSKTLVQRLSSVNKLNLNIQYKAELLLNILKEEFPCILSGAQDGILVKRFQKKGIYFR